MHAEQDPEMARYLDRSYWDQKNKEETNKAPSAPTHLNNSVSAQPVSSAPVCQVFTLAHSFLALKKISIYLSNTVENLQSSHQLSSAANKITMSSATINNALAVDSTFKLHQNGVGEDSELDEFVNTLRSQVEIFVNRMKSNSSRGRSIANDSSVQTLFMNITAMHSRLLRFIQQQDDHRGL